MNINHSRITFYQRCPRLYYWRFVQNLMSPRKPMPLILGKLVHAGLAAHYADKPDLIDSEMDTIYKEEADGPWLPPEAHELEKQREYSQYIMDMYTEHWKTEPWTVLAPEVEGSIPLGHHKFFFRADTIVSWKGHPWLLEHKTTSQLGTTFFKKFALDGQTASYIYAVWQKLNMRPIGVIVNAIRKAKNLDKVVFAREVYMRSEASILQYVEQLEKQADIIEEKMDVYTDAPEHWMMHTGACSAYNRICDYMSLCERDTPDRRDLFDTREPDYTEMTNGS